MATYLIFNQTPTTWLANQSGVGVVGVAVVITNSSSLIGKYVLLAKPRLSALTAGTTLATSITATFTPDIIGTYQVGLFRSTETVFTPDRALAVLDFIVPTAAGNKLPCYRSTAQTFRPTPADTDLADSLSLLLQYPEPSAVLGFAPFTSPPAAATFTAQGSNGPGSTLVDQAGVGLILSGAKGASDDSKSAGYYRAKSTSAGSITVCVRHSLTDTGAVAGASGAFGLYFGESTGRMKTFKSFIGALPKQLFFNNYSAPMVVVGGSAVIGIDLGSIYWMQLWDDGTNIRARYSMNGRVWTEVSSEARGTYLTTTPGGNRMGLLVAGFSSAVQAEILSYAET
jgi:hypothetical protein